MGRHLDEYAAERRDLGAQEFRKRYATPFLIRDSELVREDVGAPSDDDDTDVSESAPGFITSSLRGDIQAVGKELEAFEVRKREGGAFPDRIGVGRARNADVSLPHGRISKYHAYFSRTEDGGWQLTDASSRNGTWVDDEQLEVGVGVAMRNGKRLRFGPFHFVFLDADGFHRMVESRLTDF